MPFAVVMVFAAAGVATIFGTLAAVIAGADPAVPPRGVVRITWLGGNAVPLLRRAHMPASAPHFTYTKGDTVLEIHGDGPLKLSYASPTDDPLKGAQPGRYSFTAAYKNNDLKEADAVEVIDLTY